VRPDASRGFFFFELRQVYPDPRRGLAAAFFVAAGLATRSGSDTPVLYVGIPLSVFLRERRLPRSTCPDLIGKIPIPSGPARGAPASVFGACPD